MLNLYAACDITHPCDKSLIIKEGELVTSQHLTVFRSSGCDNIPTHTEDKAQITLQIDIWSRRETK